MFLKSGAVAKKRGFMAGIAVLAMLMTASTIMPTPVQAEQASDWLKKRRLKKQGLSPAQIEQTNQKATSSHGPVISNTKATTETEIVADKVVQPMLTADSVALMSAAQSHYEQIVANGGWPKVPKGSYKKGGNSKNIALLNKRLFIEGYLRAEATEGQFASIYTSATEDAVTRFQRNMGGVVSGRVDGPTLDHLNVSPESRLAAIRANIPRLAAYSADLGDRYVVVNVPAQQIETVSGGRVYSRHNAIVGRPERPTPVVMTSLSDINFNPYWNAPPSIIEKDIIPKLNGGTDILRKMNIKVFQGFGGPEINPDTVNWSSAVADDYHFRQEPGGENAMATAKVNFPSPFGIYLHDTPERHLFKTGNRFYSSGCVRVDKVAVLLNWVLNGQDGFDASRIDGLAQSLDRLDVKLTAPPQLRVAYLTAWPSSNGTIAFRRDIYELDGTGFTVGQPMPVGETTAEGQRYTLKPIPRQPGNVDADEAETFGLFGRAFKRGPKLKLSEEDKTADASKTSKSTKSIFKSSTTAKASTKKPVEKTVAESSKKKPTKGLFAWGATKSKTAEAEKAEKAKKLKTKVASTSKTKVVKKVETKVATKEADTTKTKKKVIAAETTKVAAKEVETTTTKKKVIPVDATKKVAAKEVDAATAKKKVVPVEAAKPADATKKAVTKKPADVCKLDAAGKLPAGCKPATSASTAQPVPQPKSTTTTTATN